MQKTKIVREIVPVIGILLMMILAYSFSFRIENAYNQRMHRDIRILSQEMIQSGVTPLKVEIFRSFLLEEKRNTSSYISSEVFNLIGVFTFMSIIIMSFSISLTGILANRKKDDAHSS